MVSLVNTKYSNFFCTKVTKYKEMAREGRGKLRGMETKKKLDQNQTIINSKLYD
jgi:hypothetical protein